MSQRIAGFDLARAIAMLVMVLVKKLVTATARSWPGSRHGKGTAMVVAGDVCAGNQPRSRFSERMAMVVAGNVCARRPAMGGAAGEEAGGGGGVEPALVGWQSW